jgi:hypothetical protein
MDVRVHKAIIAIAFAVAAVLVAAVSWQATNSFIAQIRIDITPADQPIRALDAVETFNSSVAPTYQIKEKTLTVRPSDLSAEDLSTLSQRLEAKPQTPTVVEVLKIIKFAYHKKRGEKEFARFLVDKMNDELAKKLSSVLKERVGLLTEQGRIERDQQAELNQHVQYLSGLPDCERSQYTGEFMPLPQEWCWVWDSGLLDLILLPLPISKAGKLGSAALRGLTRKELVALSRRELIRLPYFASIVARHEVRTHAIERRIATNAETEEILSKSIIEIPRKMIVHFF